jgi:HPt (histidine-containing phosphotransfer) domain-containing protein
MSIPDRLAELQQRFLASLDRRLDEMTELLSGTAEVEGLMRAFHSLAGIGGTYGFPQITDISRRCEAMCVLVMEEQRELAPLEAECLSEAVANIRGHAGRHQLVSATAE